MKGAFRAAIASASLLLAACGTSRRDQLESIAKDWCETIRASQVIPVYPLTEDLQPGDIFLVQVPVDRQQEIYRKKGFLPLDNHLARLDPDGYKKFYDHSFVAPDDKPRLPRDWTRPSGAVKGSWQPAPNAAFPTYAFSVNQSQGINLAIPISGVPVGLSLMGTQSANGTVSIKEARTLGVDTVSMYQEVEAWAASNRDFLSMYGDDSPRPRNYLRVISRIYATGRLSVQLNDARAVVGGADVGVARPVDLFLPRTPTGTEDAREAAADSYTRGLGHLNSMMASRDVPLHRSGADSELTGEQLRAKEAAREKARADEIAARKTELNEGQTLVDEAETKVEPFKTKLDEATEADAAAQVAHRDAKQKLKQAKDAQVELNEQATALQKEQAENRVNEAQRVLESTETTAKAKAAALKSAQTEYETPANELLQKQAIHENKQVAVDRLTSLAPGGSVRFMAASARSVSMEEDFDPPLIIGYLGFDMAIQRNGLLAPPVPTHAVLDRGFGVALSPRQEANRGINQDVQFSAAYDSIKDDHGREADSLKKRLDDLARHIPRSIGLAAVDPDAPGGYNLAQRDRDSFGDPNNSDFERYMTFRKERNSSIRLLKARVNDPRHAEQHHAIESLLLDYEESESDRERREFNSAMNHLFDYYLRTTLTR